MTDDDINEGPDQADADLLDDDRIELIRCPNCGEMISEFTPQCPHCKHWITNPPAGIFTGKKLWWILLAVLGIAMFILLYAL
jgi:lipopolysaccharide biosynthesis regulator YciM